MPIDPLQLDALVRQADPAKSDADLAAELSAPVKTPKRDRVTYTTCAATWGTANAATFAAKLAGAVAAGGAFGAVAQFVDKVLSGPGIDPASPEVPTQAAQFVAAGLATQEQVDGVFFNVSFPAGGVVAEADVAASRARIARAAAFQARYRLAADQYNATVTALDAAGNAGEAAPDETAVLAALGTKVTQQQP
jgi:hypothetical protein